MSENPKSTTNYVLAESPSNQEEVQFYDLICTLVLAWKTIMGITICCTGVVISYSLHMPNIYKAETILAPAQEDESGARSLLDKFGGLVAIAGVQEKDSSFMIRVYGTLNSNQFIRTFISKFDLLSVLFYEQWDGVTKTWNSNDPQKIPSLGDAVKLFKKKMKIDEDRKSGLTSISFEWHEPKIAANWVNLIVKELNEALRYRAIHDANKKIGFLEKELSKTTLEDMKKVLYSLLESEKQKAMLANVNEEFAFEVIDPAIISRVPEKPNRKLIAVLGSICGLFLGILVVLIIKFFQKMKSLNYQLKTIP